MTNKIGLVYTTVASHEEAERLAEKSIEAQLAACVNMMPLGTSIYKWEGKIEKTSEHYLIFKTSVEQLEKLYDWIQKEHSYSVPAIIKMEVDTSFEFKNYIQEQTS